MELTQKKRKSQKKLHLKIYKNISTTQLQIKTPSLDCQSSLISRKKKEWMVWKDISQICLICNREAKIKLINDVSDTIFPGMKLKFPKDQC